jgi:hypothetical protein
MGIANKQKIDKNSPGYIVSQYRAARVNLLLALAFTLVNIILLFAGTDSYFLFSATIPYVLAINYVTIGAIAVIAALLILVVYLLCYLFSKKSYGWMIAALVLFSLDTVFLLYFAFISAAFAEFIIDIAFHVFVLVYLIQGVRYGRQYSAAEQALLAAAAQQASAVNSADPDMGQLQPDNQAINTDQNQFNGSEAEEVKNADIQQN